MAFVEFEPHHDIKIQSTRHAQHDLKDLGITQLPPRKPNTVNQELGWFEIEDQYQVLKVIEHLLNRTRQLENDVVFTNDNSLDPLAVRTKQQLERLKQLHEQEASLDAQIENAQKELEFLKLERKQNQKSYAKELLELDNKIKFYESASHPRRATKI
ncbi:hypothetical protein TVAG_131020 [Trichomonas vaginalis G3]|uniref:Uncharacterized protein n=1 Tax=Trichomonas vaginalis (strain ATCC PRA-98 / G3) TaxID=412133 RepID=A2EPM5_TRIV3|nr:hypothetical protein TVAGG3_0603110 [Trichomonas vaginalis G3]EAY05368.1 hypothetical protein TVAG_131020 [Trichomonas vaginalis G3]KAI5524051.1 hypothetical protein TVAGG3_0603110 [Trichomonas vaginalis G3]|eukprot:XP_001317591.1 hypothetical protein [Trichomonas vaginalis G3]